MHENNRINKTQNMIIILNAVIGIEILTFPNVLASTMKTSGWITLLIAGLISMILTVMVTKIALKYSDETIVEFGKELVPAFILKIICILYFIAFTVKTGAALRSLIEVVRIFLLPRTPPQIVGVIMIIAIAHLARSGIESMGRMYMIITMVIIIPTLFIGIVLITQINFMNYLPAFRFSFKDLMTSLKEMPVNFSGFELIFLFTVYIKNDKKGLLKYNVFAMLIVTVFYISTYVIILGKQGVAMLSRQLVPTMAAMISIDIPNAFIENLDGIMMAIWILLIFSSLTTFLFGGSVILSKMFKSKDSKAFVIPCIVIAYIIASIPQNYDQIIKFRLLILNRIEIVTTVIIPILLFFIYLYKNRKEVKSSE
ncbi:spore germination protein [Gottschalkia purinilytica]|uniref:Spore germination protein n=2 Tax=Gottschalkia purinilytica TaxID=1503 RepID=A0A0L0WEB7_GOTPU|nr:spore germination protein [Gottschalkia purinilytica]